MIVHLLPASYDPAGIKAPVWLLHGPRKKSPHVRGFPVGDKFDCAWNTRLGAWRINEAVIDIATIAIERAMLPQVVTYCADCACGDPCDVWDEELLESLNYFVEMYSTGVGDAADPEDASRWEDFWKNAEARARSFFTRAQPGDDVAAAAAVLGVPWPGATKEDVVRAFRQKASEAHPDHDGGSDLAMKTVLHARSVIEKAMEGT